MGDIRNAAFATLAPPPERRGEFDALFRAYFLGEADAVPAGDGADEETRIKDDRGQSRRAPDPTELNEAGKAATADEVLAARTFRDLRDDERLRRFARQAPRHLPRRRAFRYAPAKSGETINLRRTLRAVIRHDGDAPVLSQALRKTRQRNILLLIDVSGSMKAHTEDYLRVAHGAARAAERVEAFTFGTRLTRISRAMRLRDPARALDAASRIVDDWDGGTRIGEALQAFLSVPRFAGYARGAVTIILSDGLERGDHEAMLDAIRKLSRRSWRLALLTPLAADDRFSPDTEALRAVLPWLDDLGNGGSVDSLCDYILSLSAGGEPWAAARWLDGRAS